MEKTAEHPTAEFSLLEDAAHHFAFLMERLNDQRLFQPDLCDVDIVLPRHQATFQAHKGVLAAYSPFFHSLFGHSKELQRVELALEALRPQGLRQILDFIYTSRLLLTSANLQDVLRAATVLQMADIAASCRELLVRGSLVPAGGAGGGEGGGGDGYGQEAEEAKEKVQKWTTNGSVGSGKANAGGNGTPSGRGGTVAAMSPFRAAADVKQEAEPASAKIYGRESTGPQYSLHVEDAPVKSEHSTSNISVRTVPYIKKEGEETALQGTVKVPADSKQIIVELNLNNQTLNVSKGLEEDPSPASLSSMHRHQGQDQGGCGDEGDEKEDEEEEDDEDMSMREEEEEGKEDHTEDDEDDHGASSEEEEGRHNSSSNQAIADFLPCRAPRQTMFVGTSPLRSRLGGHHQGRQGSRGGARRAEAQDGQQQGQVMRLEERQAFPCGKCPRSFNNHWYLDKHVSAAHSCMQACEACGKHFLLESELQLHQQTNCEKSIQVNSSPTVYTSTVHTLYIALSQIYSTHTYTRFAAHSTNIKEKYVLRAVQRDTK